MGFIDILSFCLSILGVYGLVLYLRYLLPHYIIPLISALLNETRQLLDSAEALSAIPLESELRNQLDLCERFPCYMIVSHLMHLRSSANQFARMRMESNHAQCIFRQLQLAVQRGLTRKLFALYYRIEALKSRLEVCLTNLFDHR